MPDCASLCVQVFGLGSVAQVVTGQGVFGQYLSINLGFGLGVAMGVHVGGKVSGRRAGLCKAIPSKKVIQSHHKSPSSDRYSSCFIVLSGAHMNAAVSLTMCAFGRLAWKMLPLYVFAQFLGSFLAAGTVFAVYYGILYLLLLPCISSLYFCWQSYI